MIDDELPFPWVHQGEGVTMLLEGSGALWFDPRLGKTGTALHALQLLEGMGRVDRVLVVGTVNALEVWRRHLGMYMPYWPVELARGLTPTALAAGTRAVVVNPDIVDGQRGKPGWSRLLLRWMGSSCALILDECHKYAANPRSKEYKAIGLLAQSAKVVWQLTGTYYEKSALDAHHQLKMLGGRYPMRWWDDAKFGEAYCDRKFNRFKGQLRKGRRKDGTEYEYRSGGYDYSGIRDGAELELMNVLEGVVLRRRRDECLDVPATRIMGYWVDHCDQLVSLRRDEMESLRSQIVPLKAQRTIEYVTDLVERPVVIFGHHRAFIRHVANHFQAPVIAGDTTQSQRIKLANEFQSGRHPVLVCMLAMDAVDLSAADHCVYGEIDWSATKMRQSMDRIVNGNKHRETVAHMLLVSGSVEEEVWTRILMKGRAIERLDLAARQLKELGLSMAELSS